MISWQSIFNKGIIKLSFLVLITGSLSAENYEHVIILENGSEIHGIIIEQKPNDYVRILSGKDIFVFEVDDIAFIKKVLVTDLLYENSKSDFIINNSGL